MKRAILGTNRSIATEAKGLAYTVIPHPENSNSRKAVTILLVGLWGVLTVGYQYGYSPPEMVYGTLTAFVFWRIGKLQEMEARRIEPDSDHEAGRAEQEQEAARLDSEDSD